MLVFIVDDEMAIRSSLHELFRNDHEIEEFENGAALLLALEKRVPDLVITDFQMPKVSGFDVIRKGKSLSPTTSFLMMTAHGSIDHAIEAIRTGADDYVLKPFDVTEISHKVGRIGELRAWRRSMQLSQGEGTGLARIVGNSAWSISTRDFVQKAAGAVSPVLLAGPTGSGKEAVARAIHETSARVALPFVVVSCASLNGELMESELFGHDRGAFSDAFADRLGKFELANGGTIFLDEVGEIPLALQPKLLRVLQEKSFYRLGGERQIKCDLRIIAATTHDLPSLVGKGQFREDLYFRLNVLPYRILSLAGRSDDIPTLVQHFWHQMAGQKKIVLPPWLLAALATYPYPGNIRELQNILERVYVHSRDADVIDRDAVPPEVEAYATRSTPVRNRAVTIEEDGLNAFIEQIEGKHVLQMMERAGHNQVKAAQLLKLSRATLQYKLKKYGYEPPAAQLNKAA